MTSNRRSAVLMHTVLAAVATLGMLAPTPARAIPGETLGLQGRFVTATGQPVPDGNYSVTTRFYKTFADVAPIYTEIQPTVKVANGLFSLQAGTVTPLTNALFKAGDAAWVGLQVASESELPRVALKFVPYALRAQLAADLACTGCVLPGHLHASVLQSYARADVLATAAMLPAIGVSCGSGLIVHGIQANGTLDCVTPAVASYAAGSGLALTGSTFSLKAPTVAVLGGVKAASCAVGQVVTGIDINGLVTCAASAVSGGTVTSLTAGAGLSGGTITSAGTIALKAPTATVLGGVKALTCNPGEKVNGVALDGTVTCGTDANTTYTGSGGIALIGSNFTLVAPTAGVLGGAKALTCTAGSKVTGIGTDGVPTCGADIDTNSGGTVTSVVAGTGLSGGTITGSGTLALVAPTVSALGGVLASSCTVGQKVTGIGTNGSVTCAADSSGAGTVTGVTAGAGLTGGTITTSGSLALATPTSVALGGTMAVTCPVGQFINRIGTDGKPVCALPFTVAATAPVTCNVGNFGFTYVNSSDTTLYVCNGSAWVPIALAGMGSSASYPGLDCASIKATNANAADGLYWIDPNGGSASDSFQAQCSMTGDGGGWTLLVRLNTNDATKHAWVDTAFWNAASSIGTVAGNSDYLALGYLSVAFTQIRLEYSYEGPATIAAIYANPNNAATLRGNLNLALNNANTAWMRLYSSGAVADQFFGPALRFQTSGNDADYNRIWYNLTPVAACNQGGSIGGNGDYPGNDWNWEVARGSSLDPGACQHNTYKLGVGANYDPKIWGVTPVAPTAFYNQGIMKVWVRTLTAAPAGATGSSASTAAASCSAIRTANVNAASGVYWLNPYGNDASTAFQTYCDMVSSGGGWTLVARMTKNCWTDNNTPAGSLTSPSQAACGKLSDMSINQLRTVMGSDTVFWGYSDGAPYLMPISGRYIKIASGSFDAASSQSGLLQQCSCLPTGPWSAQYDRHSGMAGVYNHSSGAWQCVTAGATGCTASTAFTSALFLYQHVLNQAGTFPSNSHGIAGGSNGWLFMRAAQAPTAQPTGQSADTAAPSCLAIKTGNPSSIDGSYWINPYGTGTSGAFQAYCDMTSSGGGWTLVSRMTKNCMTDGAAAAGALSGPSQAACAKLSDATINQLRFVSGTDAVFWGWQDSTAYPMPAPRYFKINNGSFDAGNTQAALMQQCSCAAAGPWSASYNSVASMSGVYNHSSAGWQCVTNGQTGCGASSGTSALFLYQHTLHQAGTFPSVAHGVTGGSNGWLYLR